MKKIKIFALALALVMLAMAAVSCGGSAEKVSVNCTISAVVDGETKFGPFDMTVTGDTENLPTVLQAVTEALQFNEINCEVDANNRIANTTLDGTDYKSYSDDTNIYGWIYLANGIEPETGTMAENTVNEGDVIELQYIVTPINPEDLTSDAE